MERDILIEKINSVKDASKDRNIIYEVLTELGISFKKTNCKKCLNDLMNIAKEELGLIGSAADESSFNDEEFDYVYVCNKPQSWHGHIINQDTQVEIIREFVKRFPKGYYKINKKDNMNLPVDFIGKNNEVHNVYKNVAGVPFPAGLQSVQGVQEVQEVQENNNNQ